MAEYIDRDLIEWYGCNFEEPSCKNRECSGCSYAECSHTQVMQITTADVVERAEYDKLKHNLEARIECQRQNLVWVRKSYNIVEKEADKLRSKIDKAIKEIEDLDPITERVGLQVKQEILNILKRNIGE